jgi:thiol-disulfide isomerase/thioredoxin
MLSPELLRAAFAAGEPFDAYVARGTPDQRDNWGRIYARLCLTEPQRALVRGFTRRVNILVSSGMWCGDCAHQCPMLARIAQANPAHAAAPDSPGIDLRFVDRDRYAAFADAVRICGGTRVPTAVFFSEDFFFVSVLGDKTLTRLRAKAARALGQFCPLPGAEPPEDELNQTLADWLHEIERVHLLLRLSPRLRTKHAD